MKKFKAKKKKKLILVKLIICFLFIAVAFVITSNALFSFHMSSSNEEFIKQMLISSNYYEEYQESKLNKFMKYLLNIDLKSPKKILSSFFNYNSKEKKNIKTDEIVLENNSDDPRVYIYNTHETEKYNLENYQEYNITPNVKMASLLLKGLLEKDNISTLVEEASISDFLLLNNWSYNYSYEASKFYIEETLKKYPNLDLLIDIHRDSVSKEKTTVNIDGKNYAKVLFVIGTDHSNYEQNLKVAEKLNNIIKSKYPELTRGIITKGGSGVNGVYNQNLSDKIILMELGSNENTIDEVMNTISILKDAIKEYLGGNYG